MSGLRHMPSLCKPSLDDSTQIRLYTIVQLNVRASQSHIFPRNPHHSPAFASKILSKAAFHLGTASPTLYSPDMLLPTLVLLLVSFCKAEERFNPHRITLAPRADNTLIPTVTLAPVTSFNQSLVSLSNKFFEKPQLKTRS